MPELLLELFSEEIPARMQARAADELKTRVTNALMEAGVTYEAAKAFATPRRLTLAVTGLPAEQPDVREERKGPKTDAPNQAIDGFLRSVGLTLDQCETREDKKGAFYVAIIERKGRPVPQLIAEIVPALVRDFSWPKSMRWGNGHLRWVRPLHSILCTFDGETVPFEIDGVASGNVTFGHRFMSDGQPIRVHRFDDYVEKIERAHVRLDPEDRARHILEDARTLANAQNLQLVEDDALLTEVAGIVEWPVVLMGKIDEAFMSVPPEVLTSTMRANQKYFSLRDPKTGNLAPRFIVVANLEAQDGGAAIVHGNERVLRARFSDAKFLWEQDKKISLEARLPKLKEVTFHAKLGTVAEKAERISKLAGELIPSVIAGLDPAIQSKVDARVKPGHDIKEYVAKAELAGRLCKADLVSGMVYEFPELQGIMGRYYALNDGLDAQVADAIAGHYRPQGPSDDLPRNPVAIAVSLADKLDTLVGFWAIDEKPTGSKDPYALRRAALGIIRMVLESGLRLPLSGLLRNADLLSFFADRLKVYLRDKGARHDLVDAVFALSQDGNAQDDLVLIVRRVEALSDFLKTDDGANLLAGYKRAANILKAEEKKDKTVYSGEADPKLFAQGEERDLFDRIEEARASAEHALAREDFTGAMTAIATLRAPVDRFFDKVTVNADDAAVRRNRLLLLSQIRSALHKVADFSKVEG